MARGNGTQSSRHKCDEAQVRRGTSEMRHKLNMAHAGGVGARHDYILGRMPPATRHKKCKPRLFIKSFTNWCRAA